MRSAAVGMGVVFIVFATFLAMISIQTSSILYEQANANATNAVYRAGRILYEDKESEEITSNTILKSMVREAVAQGLSSGQEATIKFYGVDCEKGLVDIEVTVPYKNLWGIEKEASQRQTIILEGPAEETT